MDACNAVEKEVDKVLSKFGGINDHADRTVQQLLPSDVEAHFDDPRDLL